MSIEESLALLASRGVSIQDIADCVMILQKKYVPDLTLEECEDAIRSVINKREVQHAILTGINLDIAAENNTLASDSLTQLLMDDAPLYGVDEVLAYGICNIYGSIALTNYGYIDKIKPGIIGELNVPHPGVCNTFLDDIVGAVAAAAAGKIAHNETEE